MTKKPTYKDLQERNKLFEEESFKNKQAEDLYRTIFENTGTAMSILDGDKTIILVNGEFEKLCGYTKKEIEGKKSWTDFVVKEDLDKMKAYHNQRRIDQAAAPKNYEFRLMDRNGNIKNIFLTVDMIPGTKMSVTSLMDITSRKKSEEALRDSQEYTKILFDSSIIPMIVMDAQTGAYVDCNDAAVKIYGYASREETLYKIPFDVSAPFQYNGRDSASEAQRNIQICREKGSHIFQWRHRRPNGEIWDADVHIMLFEHKGKPLMQFTLQDITARKKIEDALRHSEAILQSVFKAAPVGLCIMKGRIFQRANKAWYHGFGYSKLDIIGQTTRMLYESEEEYERVGRELNNNKSENGLASAQTKIKRKNGTLRDVIVTSASLDLEGPSLTIVAIEDITDYLRAEEELKVSRKGLTNIIEFLPDATFVIDKRGKVIFWNRAIEKMTGIKKENILGKDNYEYALPFYGERRPILIDYALHPDKEMEGRYTAIQGMGDIIFGEAFASNLLSADTHLSGTASVLRDNNNEIVAAIECIRDNTERKKLEERLSRAEKMEALGTLAGGVAHDLNNVLGVLVGYSELLAELLPHDSSTKKYAENILKSSMKGAAIIQDLLTLARRGVKVSEVVNMNKIILDYLQTPELAKLKYSYPKVNIQAELEDGLLNIKGSSIHLGKTIMNLVLNAVEALPGQGNVRIKTENRYLDHPVQGYDQMKEGDYVVITVSDTGIGIPAEDLSKIFEPFYTKKVMGISGTGLGLAVVWGTVKDHRGYIDIMSEKGKGSTFALYFPVTRESPEKIKEPTLSESYMSKGESILVVDDIKEQREMAISMMGRLRYQVEAVASGEEAIEYLKNKKSDLIILDMILDNGIDGLETYRRILEINPKQKAIIVSGFSETDRVRAAQELGAGEFVRKPYRLEKIGVAVREELDRKRE